MTIDIYYICLLQSHYVCVYLYMCDSFVADISVCSCRMETVHSPVKCSHVQVVKSM